MNNFIFKQRLWNKLEELLGLTDVEIIRCNIQLDLNFVSDDFPKLMVYYEEAIRDDKKIMDLITIIKEYELHEKE